MAYKRFIAGLLLVISIISVYSFNVDDDVVTRIKRQLEAWTNSHPVEKVHLHLDKPYYAAGNDIWFKAYVITGPLHRLQPDSGILNVELIDAQDSIKQSIKLQLHNGLAYGDFALPDTLHEGSYRIRAYTQYMLNAGPDYFFDRTISIGNAITNKVFTKATFSTGQNVVANINYTDNNGEAYANENVSYSVILNNKILLKGKGVTNADGSVQIALPAVNDALLKHGRIVTGIPVSGQGVVYKNIPIRVMSVTADVQFFAEGGNMISGIPAKVAFKAIGTDGLGIDITGTVTNSKGNMVAQLNTAHLGIGAFDFTPQEGETYKARVTFPDGSKSNVDLPKATNSGYVLRITDNGTSNLKITIAGKSTDQFVIIGQSGGKVYFSGKSAPGNRIFSATIAKNKFPSGIAQFTLFSLSGEPMNERLVFIKNNEDRLSLSITPENKSFSARQKVRLNINAADNEGKPAVSSLSVSVTDETKVPVNEDAEGSIMSDLLLTGDLKGYVEQPAYYFNNDNEKTNTDLDVLMLTQGYHRLLWKAILTDKPSPYRFAIQRTFTISGRVTTPSGAPVANGKVELINFDDGLLKVDTLTGPDGRFAFTDIIYADSLKFLIQARTAKNKRNVKIKIDTIPVPQASIYKNTAAINVSNENMVTVYAQSNKQLYYEQLRAGLGNHVISLQEVQIREKRIALKHSSNLNGPGNADQVLLSKDLVNFNCFRLADCLQGRLLGVLFRNGVPLTTRGFQRMQIIIDGVYSDAGFMNSLSVNDVQSIEVLRNPGTTGIYGGRGGNGVIIITTKRGDEPTYYPQTFGSGIIPYQPKGIYRARTFYSPKYDAKTNKKIADLRSTIFWKPDVITRDGKAFVEYYNAGALGMYRVVVEGVDSEGNIGRQTFKYKVVN